MNDVGAQSFRLGIAALMVGIGTSSAYAYLDPGTGSIALQVLLGGFAGIALAGRLYWNKLLSFFGLKREPQERKFPDPERSAKTDVGGRT